MTEMFDLTAWVAASCQDQGVPLHVTDPTVLRQVVTLVNPRGGGDGERGRVADPTRATSQQPLGRDPVGVQGAAAGLAGSDDRVVKDRGNDRGLSVQVQLRPRLA